MVPELLADYRVSVVRVGRFDHEEEREACYFVSAGGGEEGCQVSLQKIGAIFFYDDDEWKIKFEQILSCQKYIVAFVIFLTNFEQFLNFS